MITAIVQIKLPAPITLAEAGDIFSKTAARYQEVPGLIRKYYLLAEDGGTAGGVYLWKDREAAEAMYDADWYAFIREKYATSDALISLRGNYVKDYG